MTDTAYRKEIEELNFHYLLLAQRLINEDKAGAMLRLGIAPDMADLLASVSAHQITQLSRTNQLLCQFTAFSGERLQKVINNRNDKGFSTLHAALLMLGNQGGRSSAMAARGASRG